jgi:protein kinase C substrate 80K-H
MKEPECCDGSDEYDGKIECPNICGKVGAEYRKLMEQRANMLSEVHFLYVLSKIEVAIV